jgi:hypothetical protein
MCVFFCAVKKPNESFDSLMVNGSWRYFFVKGRQFLLIEVKPKTKGAFLDIGLVT